MITDAKWITSQGRTGETCPDFRYTFKASGKIKRATACVSALGVYRLSIGGNEVTEGLLTPGLTSYSRRIQYQTYDITTHVTEECVFSITVGNGWALSDGYWFYTLPESIKRYPRAIAEFVIEYEDGRCEIVRTDKSWQVYTSDTTYAELYHGETCDKLAEIKFVGNADEDYEFKTDLIPQESEYVREMARTAPVKLIITPNGERVIDFGQNLAGYVEIRRKGNRGDRIVLSHAEVLDKDGNFYTANYRKAKNIVTYVSAGGDDVFKPRFTFQGYRYIRLDEYPCEEVDLSEFCSVAIFTDMKRTGHFSCGNPKINQLYSNIIWGQRSNFVDIPTDCPQRDERLGWTGDAEVFCRTAAINYNVESFFRKWLDDMVLEQDEDGGIYGIVPAIRPHGQMKATGWGDAAVICPYEIYLAYGNKDFLRRYYPMMKKWVEFIHNAGDPEDEFLWVGSRHWGDWLAMDAGDGFYVGATQNDLVASAYFANSAHICAKCAAILGESEDEKYFTELFGKIKSAFRNAFMKDGMPIIYPKGDAHSTNRPVKALTQTALSLILRFGLCEEYERESIAGELVKLIAENGGRMSTGFLGTANIMHALSDNGKGDIAFDLLFMEKNPSWLFSVNHGATTMWEHWDSVNDAGEFWSDRMNSFNHYAYGAVYDWIFGYVGGIKLLDDGAGYSHITVAPHADKRLGFVTVSYETRGGLLSSTWRYLDDGRVRYDITIPRGTVAELTLPGGVERTLSAGEYTYII